MRLGDVLSLSILRLRDTGIDTPDLDARVLVCAALGMDRAQMLTQPDRELNHDEIMRVQSFVSQRCARKPVARILGYREFWGLRFKLNDDTLEPRPDSEAIIECVLQAFPDRAAPLQILDLGTGSGCLLLSLLHEYKNAQGVGSDISNRALEQAQSNADKLGLSARSTFIQSNWLENILGKYDVIVCNPPYISHQEKYSLQPEVKNYDPHTALFAENGGLACYKILFPQLKNYLTPAGKCFFEIGWQQGKALGILAAENNWKCEIKKDLSENDRVLILS